MVGEELKLSRVVLERRRDDVAVEFVVPVTTNAERSANRIERAAKVTLLAPQRKDVPPRIQVRFTFLDERDSVVRLVERVTAAEVGCFGGICSADFAVPGAVERVRDFAVGCS